MIDILIPTYNRCHEVTKNLDLLAERVTEEKLQGKFRVLVSDNHSTDDTLDSLKRKANTLPFDCQINTQPENVGLEQNAVALLSQASADFIMYIGDDDFLPVGYLSYVVERIYSDPETAAIIPGISALKSDGSISPARKALFEEKKYLKGFSTVLKVSQYGHQLSGVLLRRERLHETYTKITKLRNIYPFIFFLGYNNLRGTTYYAPKFKVSVSVSNSKDWGYDDSGLLTEIYRNYQLLFPESRIKESICCLVFMHQQRWRLRIGKDVKVALKSFLHLMRSGGVSPYVKGFLPLAYSYYYTRLVLSRGLRSIRVRNQSLLGIF